MEDRKLTKREQEKIIRRLDDEIKSNIANEGCITTQIDSKMLNLSKFIFNLEDKTVNDVAEFCLENEFEGINFCEKCGKPIIEGYCDEGDAYCSLECLGMTYDEFMEQYSDDIDCIYWTEWEI